MGDVVGCYFFELFLEWDVIDGRVCDGFDDCGGYCIEGEGDWCCFLEYGDFLFGFGFGEVFYVFFEFYLDVFGDCGVYLVYFG